MSLLKEYDADAMAVEEWLPWGGLTRPFVMQQKDGNCFCVIEYTPYEKTRLSKQIPTPKFCRGWAIWSECQHTPESDRYLLIVCWNPFSSHGSPYLGNTLGAEVEKEHFLPYFAQEAQGILREIQSVTSARLLEYQDLMEVLSFSLSMGESRAKMPGVPLYMDALLSQNTEFEFRANDILVNGKRVLALTLPGLPDDGEVRALMQDVPFRAVRRMLLFSKSEAATETRKYAGKWCPLRKTMRERIFEGIASEVNGYCYNGFVFHLEEKECESFCARLEEYLRDAAMPYCWESFNLKDVWWGSLPGVFLANVTPPLLGLASLEDFLAHTEERQETSREHRFKHLLDAMDKDKPDKKGVDLEYVSDGPVSP